MRRTARTTKTPAIVGFAGIALTTLLSAATAIAEPTPPVEPTPSAPPTATTANTDPPTAAAPTTSTSAAATTSVNPDAPVTINYQFLRRIKLDEIGVTGTPEAVMRDGLEACQKVADGMNGPQAAEYLAQKRGLSLDDSNLFVMEAVRYLCPERLDPLISG